MNNQTLIFTRHYLTTRARRPTK